MAKFIAIAPAFYDGRRVREGEQVSAPEGFKATWAVPRATVQKVEAPAAQAPVALSQLDPGKSFVEVHKTKSKVKAQAVDDLA